MRYKSEKTIILTKQYADVKVTHMTRVTLEYQHHVRVSLTDANNVLGGKLDLKDLDDWKSNFRCQKN